MASPQPIVCKPTRWFRLRASAIFLMFAVFAVLFYIDGSTGYRKKNKLYYLHQSFEQASLSFAEMNTEQQLGPDQWEQFASSQTIKVPEDTSILPAELPLPMPWPKLLHDYERMKDLRWNQLWLDYTEANGLAAKPPEKPYDARALREQWIFFVICTTLAVVSLFFLLRTSWRRITADEQAITSQDGRIIPYSDMHRLDLRRWDTKGIALADYEINGKEGRLRIDGLTYGGFKRDHGQPAEKLMELLRAKFSGELIEYAALEDTCPEDELGEDAQNDSESKPEG